MADPDVSRFKPWVLSMCDVVILMGSYQENKYCRVSRFHVCKIERTVANTFRDYVGPRNIGVDVRGPRRNVHMHYFI